MHGGKKITKEYDYQKFGQPREMLAHFPNPERDKVNLERAASLEATMRQRAEHLQTIKQLRQAESGLGFKAPEKMTVAQAFQNLGRQGFIHKLKTQKSHNAHVRKALAL